MTGRNTCFFFYWKKTWFLKKNKYIDDEVLFLHTLIYENIRKNFCRISNTYIPYIRSDSMFMICYLLGILRSRIDRSSFLFFKIQMQQPKRFRFLNPEDIFVRDRIKWWEIEMIPFSEKTSVWEDISIMRVKKLFHSDNLWQWTYSKIIAMILSKPIMKIIGKTIQIEDSKYRLLKGQQAVRKEWISISVTTTMQLVFISSHN